MSEFDTLATIEMERHRGQMLYAERQLLKAGDYEAVAKSLRKRTYVGLVVTAVGAGFVLVGGYFGGSPFQLAWGVVMVVSAAFSYSHAKRTHETIQRLKAAADASDAARGGSVE